MSIIAKRSPVIPSEECPINFEKFFGPDGLGTKLRREQREDCSVRAFLEQKGYLWRQDEGEQVSQIESRVKEDLILVCLRMLTVNPQMRPTARELLESSFFSEQEPPPCKVSELLRGIKPEPAQNERLIKQKMKEPGAALNNFFYSQKHYDTQHAN